MTRIFAEGELRDYLNSRLDQIRSEIHKESRNRLLNVDEEAYIDYLVEKYHVEDLIIDFSDVSVSDKEEMINASRFPGDFHVRSGRAYPKQVLTYHVPYSGNADLLHLMPNTRILWTMDVLVSPISISFEIINWRDDPDEIKREADSTLNKIQRQHSSINAEIKSWNSLLTERITSIFEQRKKALLQQANLLEELGVPIKKANDVPSTFSIPIKKKRPIISKPKSSEDAYSPEPTLDQATYDDILKICHHMGVEMERHPGVYNEKDEETLRDHFLMQLSPHFESVTGETFNKTGKTDILIRHEGSNIFVAECKFWKGIKSLHAAINQVLSYLTWRDSKSSILLFVRNKDFSSVLDVITAGVPEHPCFLKMYPNQQETWFKFRFHLPEDESRGLFLSVLCFHFPPLSLDSENQSG